MENDLIALFEFESGSKGTAIALEKHYRLVPPEEFSEEVPEAEKAGWLLGVEAREEL